MNRPVDPVAAPPHPEERLRAANLVFTLQRRSIWQAFHQRLDHPTADQVFESLGVARSGASRTTVYRTLETFVQLGLAQRVGHLGAAVRYDPRVTPHDHLVCERCGTVRDVELDPERAKTPEVPGFRVEAVTRLVRGRCVGCE